MTADPAARILVFDGVLDDAIAYRQRALAREFGSVDVGAVFHGIAMAGDDWTLPNWVTARFPHLHPTLTFFRRSPLGQVEPNNRHDDTDMGEFSGILYLTHQPPPDDGTKFWRRKDTGAVATTFGATSVEKLPEVLLWRDDDVWEPWYTVAAVFNRLVLFPSAYFHSRAIVENYGEGESARLIQVLFGSGMVPEEAS